jgi:hypothetical protein
MSPPSLLLQNEGISLQPEHLVPLRTLQKSCLVATPMGRSLKDIPMQAASRLVHQQPRHASQPKDSGNVTARHLSTTMPQRHWQWPCGWCNTLMAVPVCKRNLLSDKKSYKLVKPPITFSCCHQWRPCSRHGRWHFPAWQTNLE